MKNKFLKLTVLLILLTGVIYSCRQEFDDLFDLNATTTIKEAQVWYGNNKPQSVSLKFAKLKDGSKLNAKPDWKRAYTKKHKNLTAVHVPLKVQGGFGIVTPERKQAYEQTGDKRYMRSLTQMVIVTENENGKETEKSYGFLMTVVPDKAYLEETDFSAYLSTYKNWQKDFSGYVYYHTLAGDFANGWKFERGKVTKTVKPKNGNSMGLELKSASVYTCNIFYTCTYTYNCTGTFSFYENDGNMYYYDNGIVCNEDYSSYSCDTWEECDYGNEDDCYCYICCTYYDCNSGHSCGSGGGGYYPPDPGPCTSPICPVCGGCMGVPNSTNCPAPCLGHSNTILDDAFFCIMGLTPNSIVSGYLGVINEGRILSVNTTSDGIFYMGCSRNAEGKWLYTIYMDPNYFSDPSSNGTKALVAHELYHFFLFETESGNQANINNYHHSRMVDSPEYKTMLRDMFYGHGDEYYDTLSYAGTIGTPTFENLEPRVKEEIINFFIRNEIYWNY